MQQPTGIALRIANALGEIAADRFTMADLMECVPFASPVELRTAMVAGMREGSIRCVDVDVWEWVEE